jgi:imidazolonepropionase
VSERGEDIGFSVFESVWTNARIATAKDGDTDLVSIIENGAVAINNGRIVWIGRTKDLPIHKVDSGTAIHDCMGSLVTPGLVDCHTHLVFGGNRSREFELRLQGETYEQIARSGGGIASTMDSTKNTSSAELEHQACR